MKNLLIVSHKTRFVFNTCTLLKIQMIPTFEQSVWFRNIDNPAYFNKVLWMNKDKPI